MKHFSRWVALATLAGLAAALWVLGRVGLAGIWHSITRIGVGGFGLFLLAQGAVLWTLGLAWAQSAAEPLRPVRRFAWARMVREAANELLPFSQLGGVIIGLRLVLASGLPPVRVYAATVVDSLTEISSQIAYVLAGLTIAVLLLGHGGDRITAAAWAGMAVLAVLAILAVVLQRPALALAARIAGRFVPDAAAAIEGVQAELDRLGEHPGVLVTSFAVNLLAWLLSASSSAMALWLLGTPIPLSSAIAMEAMISVVKSSAFLIPGAIGAQEVGYAAIAPLVGLPAEAALALSLLKRAREVALGIPALLIWQASETRRPRRVSGRESASPAPSHSHP